MTGDSGIKREGNRKRESDREKQPEPGTGRAAAVYKQW
jgi:hypothetical protein